MSMRREDSAYGSSKRGNLWGSSPQDKKWLVGNYWSPRIACILSDKQDKGAKAELRYLGEGKSEVVMRYTSTD